MGVVRVHYLRRDYVYFPAFAVHKCKWHTQHSTFLNDGRKLVSVKQRVTPRCKVRILINLACDIPTSARPCCIFFATSCDPNPTPSRCQTLWHVSQAPSSSIRVNISPSNFARLTLPVYKTMFCHLPTMADMMTKPSFSVEDLAASLMPKNYIPASFARLLGLAGRQMRLSTTHFKTALDAVVSQSGLLLASHRRRETVSNDAYTHSSIDFHVALERALCALTIGVTPCGFPTQIPSRRPSGRVVGALVLNKHHASCVEHY